MWYGTKVLVLFAAVAAIALVAAPGASSQGGGATQLVISGQTPPGTITGNLDSVGFGIWVWCEDFDASNLYAGACVGSMYFYDIELTKFVSGEVTVLDESASFSVNLASRDGSIDCTVSGSLPATKGPSNSVHVDCSSPDREGDLTKTVVVVT
jgi:hypothetical protein